MTPRHKSNTDKPSSELRDKVKMISLCSLQAAKKFVTGKKAMAASGNLVNTPFVDEV